MAAKKPLIIPSDLRLRVKNLWLRRVIAVLFLVTLWPFQLLYANTTFMVIGAYSFTKEWINLQLGTLWIAKHFIKVNWRKS